jgi:PAS domain S-box-containing protein
VAEEDKIPDRSSDLRQRAEEMLLKQHRELDNIRPADVQRILHELQVHQIELEMQNEELRRTQQELEATREKYFDLYDLAPVGYVTLNEKGTILEANLTAAALLGIERSHLIREPLTRFISRKDQDIYYRHKKSLFETHQHHDCRVRMLKGDGTQLWARLESIISRGNNEGLTFKTAIVDITERKRAEVELLSEVSTRKQSEEQLRLFIEHAPAALAMFDRKMCYLITSRRWLSDYNLGGGELCGLSHYDVFPEIPERWKAIHRRALAGEIIRDDNDRFERADGSVMWLRWEVRPWHDIMGDVAGIVVFSEDITRRKELEEQLKQKYAELRSLSSHIQDVREEERRNITRELHDQLGQNLSVLGINLNTLKTEMPGSDRISHIENSLMLIEQMTESVRDLMADLRPPLLDEYGLAAALRWYVEQFTARTGIEVTSEVHNLDGKIDSHIENTLFRIAQEVLNNVAKHAQAKQVWVELEMEPPVVRLTISDDGVGFVPMKTQKHDGNHGWGLVTMTERAEEIGGTCRIESTPGKGTIVTIEAKL